MITEMKISGRNPAVPNRFRMNCRNANMRVIRDFVCDDRFLQLERSRTGSPARFSSGAAEQHGV